ELLPVPPPALQAATGQKTPREVPTPSLADRLNETLLALHERRLAELGLEASGLYAHYAAALGRKALIGPRERLAFGLVEGYLPPYPAYGVMRAGLGELALLLAASGRPAIAFEPNAHRRAAIEAGARRLEDLGLLAPGLLTTLDVLTPEGPFDRRVLGIGLDVAHASTEASAAPHLENARAFDALLIDLRLFIRLREAASDQMALAESLRAMGFDRRRDYPFEGLYWFHRSPSPSAAA
ncbi:MAG: hypothetical protein ACR2FH_06885, partial [Caulobacteraceae bacterium]